MQGQQQFTPLGSPWNRSQDRQVAVQGERQNRRNQLLLQTQRSASAKRPAFRSWAGQPGPARHKPGSWRTARPPFSPPLSRGAAQGRSSPSRPSHLALPASSAGEPRRKPNGRCRLLGSGNCSPCLGGMEQRLAEFRANRRTSSSPTRVAPASGNPAATETGDRASAQAPTEVGAFLRPGNGGCQVPLCCVVSPPPLRHGQRSQAHLAAASVPHPV